MADVAIRQVWEVYAPQSQQWSRAIIEKVQDGEATLRYEGTLELLTVGIDELQSNPDRFHLAASDL